MNTIFQVITLAWSLEGGQYFGTSFEVDGVYEKTVPGFVEASFEASFPFSLTKGDKDVFYIGSVSESQFEKSAHFWGFNPIRETYTFTTGIRFYGIEVGFSHMCSHPVIASPYLKHSNFVSAYTKIHAKVSGTF